MRFILVDEILDLEPGRSIRAIKTFSPDEEFFADHFPGFPVVPGVLLTEAMAQTAGKCLYSGDPARGWPMLGQIRSASFLRFVRPAESCTLAAQIKSSQAQLATAQCQVEVAGNVVARAELLFSFVPMDTFADGHEDAVLKRYRARLGASHA